MTPLAVVSNEYCVHGLIYRECCVCVLQTQMQVQGMYVHKTHMWMCTCVSGWGNKARRQDEVANSGGTWSLAELI